MSNPPDRSHKQTRETLLGELESIRSLLNAENSGNNSALPEDGGDIPLLIPEDGIPTLTPDTGDDIHIPTLLPDTDDAAIPVLTHTTPSDTPVPAKPASDPMDAVRAAAARVAASATRHRTGNKSGADNPFLPEHIRNQLHGAELPQHIRDSVRVPAPASETPVTTLPDDIPVVATTTASLEGVPDRETNQSSPSLSPAAIERCLDDVMEALAPRLETEIRAILKEKLAGLAGK